MHQGQYQRWQPHQSPVGIDFSSTLMRELRAYATERESCGMLYGLRDQSEVLVLAAHTHPEDGLETVGIFVTRIRGEVFLTEANLKLFETYDAQIALVIAGGKAGFFVRASNGSIQSVRSHEEFPVEEPLVPPARPVALVKAIIATVPRVRRQSWKLVAIGAFAALPIAAFAYLHPIARQRSPARQAPVMLPLQEENGQLRISWWPGEDRILVIEDGDQRSAIPVLAGQSNATYVRRNAELEVTLISLDQRSVQHRESIRFVGPVPPMSHVAELRAQIAQASVEADRLRSESAESRAQTASLQKAIEEMMAPPR